MIEQEIIQAVRDRKSFSTSYVKDMYGKKEGHRDVLRWSEYDTFLYLLWGHEIAAGDLVEKTLEVSDCGYPTTTTKSRLNAIFAALDIPMSCTIRKKEMVYFHNGHELPDIEKAKGMYGEYNINTGIWQVTIA
jgi:hypothetical protein